MCETPSFWSKICPAISSVPTVAVDEFIFELVVLNGLQDGFAPFAQTLNLRLGHHEILLPFWHTNDPHSRTHGFDFTMACRFSCPDIHLVSQSGSWFDNSRMKMACSPPSVELQNRWVVSNR